MFGQILAKVIGTQNERELKRLRPLVGQIGALEPTLQPLTDEQLRAKTADGTPRGLAMVTSLGNVRRAYAANRSPENKATVLGALAAVQAAIEESQRHLAAVKP